MPIYQTTSYVFDDSDHAADLFGLQGVRQHLHAHHEPDQRRLRAARRRARGRRRRRWPSPPGPAAVTFSILNIAGAGDHVVSANSLYGGTYNLFVHTLPRFGLDVDLVDPGDPENFRRAHQARTRSCSTPRRSATPSSTRSTFDAVADIAHEAGIPLIVDNTMPTPYLIRPIEHGADIVVHSATKFIGGHGTSIGGVVVDSGRFDWVAERQVPRPRRARRQLPRPQVLRGARAASPTSSSCASACCATSAPRSRRSTRSSSCRGSRRCRCAWSATARTRYAVARYLEEHPKVGWVNYPGLPSHPAHELAAKVPLPRPLRRHRRLRHQGRSRGRAGASSRARELLSHLANIGDAKSLVIHPATTTHSQLEPEEQHASRRDRRLRAPLGRHRVDRRHHRRHRPGAGAEPERPRTGRRAAGTHGRPPGRADARRSPSPFTNAQR